MIRRFLCVLFGGHAWTHFYTRDYGGREALASHCAKCGHSRRDVVA